MLSLLTKWVLPSIKSVLSRIGALVSKKHLRWFFVWVTIRQNLQPSLLMCPEWCASDAAAGISPVAMTRLTLARQISFPFRLMTMPWSLRSLNSSACGWRKESRSWGLFGPGIIASCSMYSLLYLRPLNQGKCHVYFKACFS